MHRRILRTRWMHVSSSCLLESVPYFSGCLGLGYCACLESGEEGTPSGAEANESHEEEGGPGPV